ncbi:MAG: hypothetical protein EPN20_13840 [Magnetospirillum sp.]|nr:MAG: hypothetical protein EPN20_13840 [Magnetospirillum sp.]
MQLGMIGLGRMGANMVRRLLRGGHQCVVFDANPDRVRVLTQEGATGASSLDECVCALTRPRAAWVMVPAGDPTEQMIIAAIEEAVPADVLSALLYARFRSRQAHTFVEKLLSAMRQKFGGHTEHPSGG